MILHAFLLILGLILVVVGADYFVAGSSLIAKRFGIPKLIIGLTIVALGTSAPELGVNVFASIDGYGQIALGNILGSNISNTLLIFGIAALFVKKVSISRNSLTQVSLSVLVSFILLFFALFSFGDGGRMISQIEGLILTLCGLFYWLYLYKITKANKERLEDEDLSDNKLSKISNLGLVGGITFLSLVALLVGSKIATDSAVFIAEFFGISQLVIAGTVIAISTSLPELVTSIQALRQKQYNLMIGNIVGSNIINSLFILGVSTLINPISIDSLALPYLYINGVVAVLLLVSFTVFVPRQFRRWQAYILIVLYVLFIIFSLY